MRGHERVSLAQSATDVAASGQRVSAEGDNSTRGQFCKCEHFLFAQRWCPPSTQQISLSVRACVFVCACTRVLVT